MLRRILAAAVLAIAASAQSPVQVKVGALVCGAIRRPVTAGMLNVQSYCYAGNVAVTNKSTLIAAGGATMAIHVYGAGCGTTGSPCDKVVWQFTDSGNGVIAYQAATDGSTLKTGNLP